MPILILDDVTSRHGVLSKAYAGQEIIHVFDAMGAIAALQFMSQFDLVHLDHDLNDQHYDTDLDRWYELTGMDVVSYIIKMPIDRRPKKAIVHSWNGPRAILMTQLLNENGVSAIYQPFTSNESLYDGKES